ncbi:unnamed protein product [Staurois parvus]|uniref:Uncharacterized protein n=1 Tax=Staurois parvus TaxID=386267 RepID=A0ABN9FCL9_9NEOB|nr:unnamed protein product [Staurois parvus]
MGPPGIRDHGTPMSSPTLKPHPKKPLKGTRGISWGPLLTPGPLGQCPSFQMVSPPLVTMKTRLSASYICFFKLLSLIKKN